jgi:hypothetical protein
MKKIFTIALSILIFILALGSDGLIKGQPPAPPGEHGLSGNQPGGNAPLDGGSLLLMLGGAVYGVVKWIRANYMKKNIESDQ